eukprot:14455726-Alexandrium_andersonii.AAC.1
MAALVAWDALETLSGRLSGTSRGVRGRSWDARRESRVCVCVCVCAVRRASCIVRASSAECRVSCVVCRPSCVVRLRASSVVCVLCCAS